MGKKKGGTAQPPRRKKGGGGGDQRARAEALRRLPGGAAAQEAATKKKKQQEEAAAKAGAGGANGSAAPAGAQAVELSIAAEGAVRRALEALRRQRPRAPHARGASAGGGAIVSAEAEAEAVRAVAGQLLRHGFTEPQIGQALDQLPVGGVTASGALDWLCLHVAADLLPRQFASGTHSYASEGHVTVLARQQEREDAASPAARAAEAEAARKEKERAMAEERRREEGEREAERRRREREREREREAQKAYILSYMETVSDEEEDGGAPPAAPRGLNEAAGDPTILAGMEGMYTWAVWSDELEVARRKAERPEDRDTLAAALQEEMALVRQEAANAKAAQDRKKQAVAGRLLRDLIQDLKAIGITVDKKTGRVREEAAGEKPGKPPGGEAEEDAPDFDLFASDGGGAFAPADGPEAPTAAFRRKAEVDREWAGPRKGSKGKAANGGASAPDEHEPRLPKALLQQYCQRRKVPAPRFERVKTKSTTNSNKYAYSVTVHKVTVDKGRQRSRPTTLHLDAADGTWSDIQSAQNAVAAKALHVLCPDQPLQHLLPEPYRALWLGWDQAAVAQETSEASGQAAAERAFLDGLVARRLAHLADPARAPAAPEESILRKVQTADLTPARERRGGRGGRERGRDEAEGARLLAELRRRRAEEERTGGHPGEHLPVRALQEELVDRLETQHFIIVQGETGSGKTTQTPQMILDHEIERGRGAEAYIVCTQPRRIAAVSVAERVAEERREPPPGRRGSRVGYHVRLDAAASRDTKLLFCTTGILLRQLAGNPMLEGVSHVVIDEVHERTMQSDFLLALVRAIARRRNAEAGQPPLKVILMSATMDATLFSAYLGGCKILSAPGRTFPVKQFYLENIYEMTGYQLAPDSRCCLRYHGTGARRAFKAGTKDERALVQKGWGDEISGNEILSRNYDSERYYHFSDTTRRNLMRLDEGKIDYDLLEELLAFLVDTTEAGAVLVFLPGVAEINRLHDQLSSTYRFRHHWLLPCHSNVNPDDQRKIFVNPPAGCRKIVLATNIAETSITIDDVVYVIDSGRVKERQYDAARGMGLLVEGWVSAASARQRKGRAGRVQPGQCFALYTEMKADDMVPYATPEIMRVPLEELCLQIKVLQLGHCKEFLMQVVQPPSELAIDAAVRNLQEAGALDPAEALTSLGHHLAGLPVDAKIGKMLIISTMLGCLDPVLTISACLSFKSPFSAPMDARDAADRARKAIAAGGSGTIAAGQFSDHLTVLAAYDGWRREVFQRGRGGGHRFAKSHYLSESTLGMISELRGQLAAMLADIGFLAGKGQAGGGGSYLDKARRMAEDYRAPWNTHADKPGMIKAALCAGLYPNVAIMEHQGPAALDHARAKWFDTDAKEVAVHPSSINHGDGGPIRYPYPYMTYLEKVRTSRTFLRDCSILSPYALLLFGGEISVQHESGQVTIDNWIHMKAPAQTAVLFKELRSTLTEELQTRIVEPNTASLATSPLTAALAQLLEEEAK